MFTTTNSSPRSCRAFTLPEMMVAVGIGALILAAFTQLSMYTARSFAAMGNYTDLDRASRNTLGIMSRDLREAKKVINYTDKYIRVQNLDTNSWLAFGWDPTSQQVYRAQGTFSSSAVSTNVLLKGCDFFQFRVWMRNPTNQFWFPYSASSQPSLTKLVDISWRCSRRVISQLNTESVQTAKIVLRN